MKKFSQKGSKELQCLENFEDKVVLHYCSKKDMEHDVVGHGGVDWLIGDEKDIEELTANMAGFKTEKSQRIIIDYDKGYGKFLVRRIYMDYGASKDTP